jgi:glycosyltransferase involved in cell wall biosynthesis
VYEYLRTGRPILALATGDTASVVRSAGIGSIAPLESARAIRDQLMAFLQMLRNGNAPGGSEAVVQKHSRRHKTRELSELLLEVAAA